jgi:hypothetical protein
MKTGKYTKVKKPRKKIWMEDILYYGGIGLGLAGIVLITSTAVYDSIKDKDSQYNQKRNEKIILEKDLEKSVQNERQDSAVKNTLYLK